VVDGYWLAGLPSDQMRTLTQSGDSRTSTKGAAMDSNTGDQWITRQELAERYGLPVKTPAQWASKGTGPRYARFGRHVRYRLSDVVDWEAQQFADAKRTSA
jgi:predicted DNA-binding transcriptional regulator AlpA